jgi:serine/threonine protein phosphatase PrpC
VTDEAPIDQPEWVDTAPPPDAVLVDGWAVATARAERHANEDRFAIDGRMFGIADGMGALSYAGIAAATALTALFGARPTSSVGLADGLFLANNAVRALGLRARTEVGTTMVAALVGSDGLSVISVGDSRAYLASTRGVEQLTEDDNRAAEQGLSPDDPGFGAAASTLTASLGARAVMARSARHVAVEEPSRLILLSDGVHSHVARETLLRLLGDESDPSDLARGLVDAAHQAGADDDATVVVVDLRPASDSPWRLA